MNYLEYEKYICDCKQIVNNFLLNLKNVDYRITKTFVEDNYCYVCVMFSYNNYDVDLKIVCLNIDKKISIRYICTRTNHLRILNNDKDSFFCVYSNFNEQMLIDYINLEKEKHVQFIEQHKDDLCCD